MSRKRIYLFWGGMDLVSVLNILLWSLMQGRVPFYDDYLSFLLVNESFGGNVLVPFFVCSMLLNLSVVVSALMLIAQHPSARFVAYAQTPFRLAFVLPSISLILWGGFLFQWGGFLVVSFLLLASESVKVFSLYKYS